MTALPFFQNTLDFALQLDAGDKVASFRERFFIPESAGKGVIYFCGNSLGLQPRSASQAIKTEMEKWEKSAVEGHFRGESPWLNYHKIFKNSLAYLTGAKLHEVVAMNNLTTNLHLMLVSFYQPTPGRYKIICEGGAFPSDQYALESQVRFHSYKPVDAIIELQPRPGEDTLRTEDICRAIRETGDQLALLMLGGVNYYTGQCFDMQTLTQTAHEAGAFVGFDLAHAIGNVPLQLHEWEVDFAVWCSYKYLNSGPGGVAGAFVHERFANDAHLPRFAGWWGHDEATRFEMRKGFQPMPGADGWQLANGAILTMAVHKASLDIFEEAGLENLRQKSVQLTGFLEFLLQNSSVLNERLKIITPENPQERGCQLSLRVIEKGRDLFEKISQAGLICDWREPDAIRLAPVPLYNNFKEVWQAVQILESAWQSL
jgi:kynureninase